MPLLAQSEKKAPTDTIKIPFYQGIFVELDVAPFVENSLINKYAKASQAHAMLNIKNKYFPVVEIGYAEASQSNSNGALFSTAGLYQKIGLDFRLLKPKVETVKMSNFVLGGIRLGMSSFNYSFTNVELKDNYWGGSEIINKTNIHTTQFWFELTAGLRIPIYKNIYVGWNVRNKHLFRNPKDGEETPWFIPGYGINDTSAWGFSYIVGYRF